MTAIIDANKILGEGWRRAAQKWGEEKLANGEIEFAQWIFRQIIIDARKEAARDAEEQEC